MCLYAKKDSKLQVAEEDIVCYKRLLYYNGASGTMFGTPYQFAVVTKRQLMGKICFTAKGKKEIVTTEWDEVKVGGGFIHTYAFSNHADRNCSRDDQYIFKCIIPKGTEYMVGTDSYGYPSFASRKIRFVDVDAKKLAQLL